MAAARTLGRVRVATINLASGRGPAGESLHAVELAGALAEVDADVVAVQELDVGQPRSHGVDQPAVVADAVGATDWRFAATLLGTPEPSGVRSWVPADPVRLRGPGDPVDAPAYGVAVFSRRPVRRWRVVGLAAGIARLPVRGPDPRTGEVRTWWFPDEPRAAVVAELDGLTVVGTHLSFAPHTAVRQLLRVRAERLPSPVLLAGDLNLPGPAPAALTGGARLVRSPTYPAPDPRLQLDHLLAFDGLTGGAPDVRALAVGDHRMVSATVS